MWSCSFAGLVYLEKKSNLYFGGSVLACRHGWFKMHGNLMTSRFLTCECYQNSNWLAIGLETTRDVVFIGVLSDTVIDLINVKG